MNQRTARGITRSEGGFTLDAELVAGELVISPDNFWQEVSAALSTASSNAAKVTMPGVYGSLSVIVPNRGR